MKFSQSILVLLAIIVGEATHQVDAKRLRTKNVLAVNPAPPLEEDDGTLDNTNKEQEVRREEYIYLEKEVCSYLDSHASRITILAWPVHRHQQNSIMLNINSSLRHEPR